MINQTPQNSLSPLRTRSGQPFSPLAPPSDEYFQHCGCAYVFTKISDLCPPRQYPVLVSTASRPTLDKLPVFALLSSADLHVIFNTYESAELS